MQISPITNPTNNVTSRGCVSKKLKTFNNDIGIRWLNTADSGKYKSPELYKACVSAAKRIYNVSSNMQTIMERFCHACVLTFEKSKKSGIYRFFIEHPLSNYKVICGDVNLSRGINKLEDIEKLEELEEKIANISPYKENSNFIIQRKPNTKGKLNDMDFVPDRDFVFLEDELEGKNPEQATLEDIKIIVEAAKEEGLL